MTLKIYEELEQGSPEWLAARCGIVTASVVGNLVSKSMVGAIGFECPDCGATTNSPCLSKPNKDGECRDLKTLHPVRAEHARSMNVTELVPSTGDAAKTLMHTLIAERITGYVEPVMPNRAMKRGTMDEPYARAAYAEEYAPVTEVGFITEDKYGFVLGYSPDGLVGNDGLIEIKSRDQRSQLSTFLLNEVPAANMAQLQAGLLVTQRAWIDYVSYCGGMPLFVERVYPDPAWHRVILEAVSAFEATATNTISQYLDAVADKPVTERIDHFEDLELRL